MITEEQKRQINDLLRKSVQEISLSEAQHETLVKSYEAVGKFLAGHEALERFRPEIHPQGSIRLGTAIKPVAEEDDMDIDLVCEFTNIPVSWTQKDLKEAVGRCFKESDRYSDMLEKKEGGKRCWTLLYREGSTNGYHMDILPAVVANNYGVLLERFDYKDYGTLAISITDKTWPNYATEINHNNWPHSNPFGYAKWFKAQCQTKMLRTMSESVEAAPKYGESNSVLQNAVKILKRHRDLMFDGDDDKPISIIITTLAAKAYNGEDNLYDALLRIVSQMPTFIEERIENGRRVKFVPNPVDNAENFADKWVNEPRKEEMFYKWVDAVRTSVAHMSAGDLKESQIGLESLCGQKETKRVFEAVGREMKQMRDDGMLRMGSTGLIGSVGTKVAAHNFHGE